MKFFGHLHCNDGRSNDSTRKCGTIKVSTLTKERKKETEKNKKKKK